jgi:hypothetical protein
MLSSAVKRAKVGQAILIDRGEVTAQNGGLGAELGEGGSDPGKAGGEIMPMAPQERRMGARLMEA